MAIFELFKVILLPPPVNVALPLLKLSELLPSYLKIEFVELMLIFSASPQLCVRVLASLVIELALLLIEPLEVSLKVLCWLYYLFVM